MTGEIIDAYCHCGVSKYRPIEDVRRVMERFGVARTVLIQHLGEYDNSYIGGIVAAQPDRFAGVFTIDTEAADARDSLARWARQGVFRGIRLLGRTLDASPELWEQAADLGLNIVVYGEPTLSLHAGSLADFLGRHPRSRLILSHFGVLVRSESPGFGSWDRILSLADCPNAFMQVSGMHMFAPYPYAELVPLVRRALSSFGPGRLLYGSNYPVVGEDSVYGQELDLLLEGQFGIPSDTAEDVVGRTARKLWFDDDSAH